MPDLYVRVKPKSGAQQFYRCAMLFTLAWSLVSVDDATAQRLHAEQMLEVSAQRPADYTDAPVEQHASPVDPANNAGEGAEFEAGAHGGGDIYALDDAPASPAKAQAEGEAEAQARMEAEAEAEEAAPVAPAASPAPVPARRKKAS